MNGLLGEGGAARLRVEFDREFTLPHPSRAGAELDFIVIGVGGAFALWTGAFWLTAVLRGSTDGMTSGTWQSLGLTGLRGVGLVLAAGIVLLGYAAATAPRWLVQVKAASAFALAFEHFERHLRAPAADFAPGVIGSASAPAHASGSVKTEQGPVTTLDLLGLFETSIKARGGKRREEEGP